MLSLFGRGNNASAAHKNESNIAMSNLMYKNFKEKDLEAQKSLLQNDYLSKNQEELSKLDVNKQLNDILEHFSFEFTPYKRVM